MKHYLANNWNALMHGESNRKPYLDLIKGLGSIMVILSHAGAWVGSVPSVYNLFISFIMLPSFFLVSGYLISPKKSLAESLYYRIGKLLVLYIIMAYFANFFNLSLLRQALHQPRVLWDTFLTSSIHIATGRSLWFVACLIVAMAFVLLCIHLTNHNLSLLFGISLATAVVGYIFRAEGEMIFWSVDTAAVCQLFLVIGYTIKRKGQWLLDKINLWISLGLFVCYTVVVVMISLFVPRNVSINIAINQWGILPLTLAMLLLGNVALFCLCKAINRGVLLSYIGKHSLLYFAIASHFGSVAAKVFYTIARITGLGFLLNPYALALLVTLGATLLMAVFCILVDLLIPFLNGSFKMPRIKAFERKEKTTEQP